MSYLHLAVVIALCTFAAGCTDLQPLVRGACGNGVIEPEFGEDCDGPTDARCGAASDPVQACRRLCDLDAATLCAAGAACGGDGICHQASGSFSSVSERSWSATDTLVIDSNGDGAPDLVGVSSQRVDLALGFGDGAFATTTTFPGQYVTGAPAVGDPTGDGLPDVIIPTPIGVVTMAGDFFDGLVPVTQNTVPVPWTGRILYGAGPVGSTGVLVSAVRLPSGVSVLAIDREDPEEDVIVPFPGGRSVNDVIGSELSMVSLVSLAGESVVFVAFPDGVWLVGLRVAGNGIDVDPTPFGMVALDPGSGAVKKVFVANTNADAFPDLVFITGGVTDRIQVLEGTPVSNLQSFRGFGLGQANTIWVPGSLPEATIGPLALRDAVSLMIDADGVGPGVQEAAYVSVVAARRSVQILICFADGVPACFMQELRRGVRDWTHASVIDVNGDDQPDLVGYAEGDANVDVLLASDLGFGLFLYNDAVLATPGSVLALEFGELDGDGVVDTVVLVGTRAADATDHELHVAFGARRAAPAPPALVAKLGSVVAVVAVNAPFPFRVDGLDDLLVLSDRAAGDGAPSRGGAVLFGSTSRRLVAPLLLSTTDYITPIALAPMYLDDRAGEDLVVFGRSASGFEALPFSPDGFTMELLGGMGLPVSRDISPDRALWTTVARTGDLRIGAAADNSGKVIALEFPCAPCMGGLPVTKTLMASMNLPPASALRATDFDGDGDDDLIGVFDSPIGISGEDGRAAEVALWINDAGMVPAAAHVFTIADDVYDAVAADLDLDGVPEIVFAARRGVLIAHNVAGVWQAPTELYPRPPESAPAVYIEAVDLTGDGLLDLVVAAGVDRRHPFTLEVLGQIEIRSASAEPGAR